MIYIVLVYCCSLRSLCLSHGHMQYVTSLLIPIDALTNNPITIGCSNSQTAWCQDRVWEIEAIVHGKASSFEKQPLLEITSK